MHRFAVFDVVKLTRELGPDALVGAEATVLEIHERPTLAYEIEIVDESGRTVLLGAAPADAIRPA